MDDAMVREWEGILNFNEARDVVAVGRSAAIVSFWPGTYIAHVRWIDAEALEVLRHRPGGAKTSIDLHSLRPDDDLSVLDSHLLSVSGAGAVDVAPFYHLNDAVRHLAVSWIKPRQRLTLGRLANVRCVSLDWASADLGEGYGPMMRQAWFDKYAGEDLTALNVAGVGQMEELSIIQSRKLRSLHGLEAFSRLDRLELYGCPKLTDFSALPRMQALRSVSIQSCRGLSRLDGLVPDGLDTLAITDCGPIESASPLIGHPHLRQVALNGSTVVADGDLSPLLRMPALRNLLIANRRGYRPSRADLAAHGLNDSDWDPPLDRCK